MATKSNSKQIVTMSVGAVGGAVVGGLVGIVWMSPAVLIPIGLVIGLSIGLAVSRR